MRRITLTAVVLAVLLAALVMPASADLEPQDAGEPTPYPDFGVAAPGVTRIPGATRFHTAAMISMLRFPHESHVDQVIVANGYSPPDALAASMWTHSRPLLLVTETGVPGPTRSELRRYEPRSIVVLGGEGVIQERVVRRLRQFVRDG